MLCKQNSEVIENDSFDVVLPAFSNLLMNTSSFHKIKLMVDLIGL